MVLFKTKVYYSKVLFTKYYIFLNVANEFPLKYHLNICRESGDFLFKQTEISYIFDALCQAC